MRINYLTSPSCCQQKTILLTFDVEEWFQVENFKQWISYESWSSSQSRVVESTHRILDLLDDCSSQRNLNPSSNQNDRQIRATFFILGWVAEKHPELVREIHSRGHEVASHGYEHKLCNQQSTRQFRNDLNRSKKILEDITGDVIHGYRAPSFSISDRALIQIRDAGYRYDSSFNSFALHGRYGQCNICKSNDFVVEVNEGTTEFFELPVSNLTLNSFVIPWGGGAYFRLFPFFVFSAGVRTILKRKNFYLMYLHPWEFDPHQPKVQNSSWERRLRHYTNLNKTLSKFQKLLHHFTHCRFIRCNDFLQMR